MLVSPDRLKWTYGESLAADTQYWCQLLRNVHTQSQGWTHTTPTQHIASLLHMSCPELLAVMLSDYLRTCSVQALWAFWNLLDFLASILAKGRHPVWTLDQSDKCKATEREGEGGMEGKITAKKLLAHSERRALFKNRPPKIALYPFVCVFCLKGCVLAHFTCVVWCPFWPENPFWGSQVEFCVKDTRIVKKPGWQRYRSIAQSLLKDCAHVLPGQLLILILVGSQLDLFPLFHKVVVLLF